jgi:hypothetical protein
MDKLNVSKQSLNMKKKVYIFSNQFDFSTYNVIRCLKDVEVYLITEINIENVNIGLNVSLDNFSIACLDVDSV